MTLADPGREEATKGRRPLPDGLSLRVAVPDDAEGIIEVFRQAMPAVVIELNVLGVRKAPALVRRSIEASARGGDTRYWVAVERDRSVVGFAQLRRGLHDAVIDNLHVAPEHQALGIGTALLRLVTPTIEAPRVGVDIFESSTVSRHLFDRLGFRPDQTRHWHVLEPSTQPSAGFVIRDLPQADAVHAAFDLSRLHVETSSGLHHVGRMGDALFRITSAAAVQDEGFLAALAALDPRRSVLAILQAREDPLPGPARLVSQRLRAPLDVLSANLGVSPQ